MLTTLYINFSDAQGQIAAVSGGIWPKYELIQAEMIALLTCKNNFNNDDNNQRTNGPVNVHQLSEQIISTKPVYK